MLRLALLAAGSWLALAAPILAAPPEDRMPAKLPGVMVDDDTAELQGTWRNSTSVRPFIGPGYRTCLGPMPEHSIRYAANLPAAGKYRVLICYTAAGNRAPKVPVTIETAKGEEKLRLDQTKPGTGLAGFHLLGEFEFAKKASVTLSADDTTGHVIADAVWFITPPEEEMLRSLPASGIARLAFVDSQANPPRPGQPKPVAKKPEEAKPAPPPVVPAPPFVPQAPSRAVAELTPDQLDKLLAPHLGKGPLSLVDDDQFLRRVALDLVGRPPTLAERTEFRSDTSADRRGAAIERFLASPDFGRNWSNALSDAISARIQEPELTFYDYRPFKEWLASELNAGRRWDEMAYRLLTAKGTVNRDPAATYIGFHQANANRLAGETSRLFLGVQIHCAECHDHPFVDLKQTTFHSMAAFFARTGVKIPQKESGGVEITMKDKGEQTIPGKKGDVAPAVLGGKSLEAGLDDDARRQTLARWMTAGDNPWFSKAMVNRIWHRMMGRGFCEPVDNIDEGSDVLLPEIHAKVADHFLASGCDLKSLMRLIAKTDAYQRKLGVGGVPDRDVPWSGAHAKKLRGDEVFDSLVVAIGLPNVTPPPTKPTDAIRFPPPPKSTRDLVNDAFGYDPSTPDEYLLRTLKQAMFLMNNPQVQKQVDAKPESGTMLARLLASETDDAAAASSLFETVLARRPSEREAGAMKKHLSQATDRGAGFEDLLWSLLNSAEFTTRP